MYLSDQQTGQLADLMSTLAEPFEEEEIRARVGARMMDLLGAQYYASYVWDAATQTFGHAVQINMDPANLQLLDLVRPAFVAALRRCRQRSAPAVVHGDTLLEALSGREREVARLVSCGLTDKEVARRLGISLTTVRTHIGHAFRKLDVDN